MLAFYFQHREAHDHFLDLGLGFVYEDFLSLGALHDETAFELAVGELGGQFMLVNSDHVCGLFRLLLGFEVKLELVEHCDFELFQEGQPHFVHLVR